MCKYTGCYDAKIYNELQKLVKLKEGNGVNISDLIKNIKLDTKPIVDALTKLEGVSVANKNEILNAIKLLNKSDSITKADLTLIKDTITNFKDTNKGLLDNVKEYIDEIEPKLDSIVSKMSAVISVVEKEGNETQVKISEVTSKIAESNTTLEAIAANTKKGEDCNNPIYVKQCDPATPVDLSGLLGKLDTLIDKATKEVELLTTINAINDKIREELINKGDSIINKLGEVKTSITEGNNKLEEIKTTLSGIKLDLAGLKDEIVTVLNKIDTNTDNVESLLESLNSDIKLEFDELEALIKSEFDESQLILSGIKEELEKDRNVTSSIIHTFGDEKYIEVPLLFDDAAVMSGDPLSDEVTIEMIPNYGIAISYEVDVLLKIEKANSFYYDKNLLYDVETKRPFGDFNTKKEAYRLHEDSIEFLKSLPTYENLEDAYYLGVVEYNPSFPSPLYGLVLRFKTTVGEYRKFYGACRDFEPVPFEPTFGTYPFYAVKYEEDNFAKYILEHVYDNDNKLLETNCYDGTTTNGIPNKVAVPEKFIPGEPISSDEETAWVVSNSVAHSINGMNGSVDKFLLETHENKVTGEVKSVWYELINGEKSELQYPPEDAKFGEPNIVDIYSTAPADPLPVSVVGDEDFEIVSREVCVPEDYIPLGYDTDISLKEIQGNSGSVYRLEMESDLYVGRKLDDIIVNITFEKRFKYNGTGIPEEVTLKELMELRLFRIHDDHSAIRGYGSVVNSFTDGRKVFLDLHSQYFDINDLEVRSYAVTGHHYDKTLELRHFYKNGKLYDTKAYDGLTEVDIPEETKSGKCSCEGEDFVEKREKCKDPHFIMKTNNTYSGDVLRDFDGMDSEKLTIVNPTDIAWEVLSGDLVVEKAKTAIAEPLYSLVYNENTIRGASFEGISGHIFVFKGSDFTVHWKCGKAYL